MAVSKIVCVSANPAMDRRLRVESLIAGEVIRAKSAQGFAGGKAAHVAMAIRALGGTAAWIGFLGGAIGQECGRQLEDLGIHVVTIPSSASTRVNLEIIDATGKITEILEPGNAPPEDSQRELVSAIRQQCQDALLVLSGSLPAGVRDDFYVSIIEIVRTLGVPTFVDTSGPPLRVSAAAHANLVKINRAEAEDLAGRSLKSVEETVAAMQEIIKRGPESVAITAGEEGLIWVEGRNGPAWQARPPRLHAVSTVGCGDATLAGFASAALQGLVGEEAVRLAAACGAANCLALAPGRIELVRVRALLPQIEVQRLA